MSSTDLPPDSLDLDPYAVRARLDDQGWADIREDYESGEPPSILAERHGVGERTIRRRAAAEGWVRRRPRLFGAGDPTGAMGALDFFVKTRRAETDDLLLAPSPEGLSTFAFRRATEAAALGRPAEAAGWLRLIDQLRRNAIMMERLGDEAPEADVRRAIMTEAIAERWRALREADADPPPEGPEHAVAG